jgi:hypothetical protein
LEQYAVKMPVDIGVLIIVPYQPIHATNSAIRHSPLVSLASTKNNGDINHKRPIQGATMSALTASPIRTTTKILGFMLVCLIVLVAFSILMVSLHETGNWSGGLVFGDSDVSDSLIGWMIAIPVLIITAVIVTVVMLGVGILLAAVVAMALVLALVAVVFGVAMVVLPMAAFIAIPVLIVWGIVKLVSNNNTARKRLLK